MRRLVLAATTLACTKPYVAPRPDSVPFDQVIESHGAKIAVHVRGTHGPICLVEPGGPGLDWTYLRADLAKLHARALVIGRHDAITSVPFAEELHHALAGSQLVVLEHSGHMGHVEEPDVFARAVTQFVTAQRLRDVITVIARLLLRPASSATTISCLPATGVQYIRSSDAALPTSAPSTNQLSRAARVEADSGTSWWLAGTPGISVTIWPSPGVTITGGALASSAAQSSSNTGASGTARCRPVSHAAIALGSTRKLLRS